MSFYYNPGVRCGCVIGDNEQGSAIIYVKTSHQIFTMYHPFSGLLGLINDESFTLSPSSVGMRGNIDVVLLSKTFFVPLL